MSESTSLSSQSVRKTYWSSLLGTHTVQTASTVAVCNKRLHIFALFPATHKFHSYINELSQISKMQVIYMFKNELSEIYFGKILLCLLDI